MPQRTRAASTRFAGPSNPFVYERPDGTDIQHLLWGDWLRLEGGRQGEWVEVHARGCDGWMKADEIQSDRLLEVVFLDVGQGDGCLVVTPEDEHVVIDAGEDDSMYRFLNWRYGGFRSPWSFDAAILSHPDQDHYRGFDDLFTLPNVSFDVIYHNGILEYRGDHALGRTRKIGGTTCLTDLCRDETDLERYLGTPSNWKHPTRRRYDKRYATLLKKGLDDGRFTRFRSLARNTHSHVPGWEPGAGKSIELEVLGPAYDEEGGRKGLRWFGTAGKTKNGHSVVVKLRYGDVTILLGGDLNIPSQEWLLEYHTGLDPRPATRDEHDVLVRAARRVFQVDIAKACHHGAGDVSTRFMEATNPIATVISSGDDESYGHPRADALGAAGRHGRGNRPLVFSTELGRSAPDTIKHPHVLKRRLIELRSLIKDAEPGSTLERRLIREFDTIVGQIDRSVAVYGAIQVRTDGNTVVIAQKLERPRGTRSGTIKWDVYRLVARGGALQYDSRYD